MITMLLSGFRRSPFLSPYEPASAPSGRSSNEEAPLDMSLTFPIGVVAGLRGGHVNKIYADIRAGLLPEAPRSPSGGRRVTLDAVAHYYGLEVTVEKLFAAIARYENQTRLRNARYLARRKLLSPAARDLLFADIKEGDVP